MLPSIKTLWVDIFPKYHSFLKPTPIWKSLQVRAETTDFIGPIIQHRCRRNNQKRTPYIFLLCKTKKQVTRGKIYSYRTHRSWTPIRIIPQPNEPRKPWLEWSFPDPFHQQVYHLNPERQQVTFTISNYVQPMLNEEKKRKSK